MAFQTTVNRQYATGIVGEIRNDGPVRALPARIVAGATGTVNRVGRVFSYNNTDITAQVAGMGEIAAVVGGTNVAGILAAPKSYASYGVNSNYLAPTLDLAAGTLGEFLQMGIITVNVEAPAATANVSGAYGAAVYYISDATTDKAAIGSIVTASALPYTPGDANYTFTQLVGAKVLLPNTAVAAGVVAPVVIQITQ